MMNFPKLCAQKLTQPEPHFSYNQQDYSTFDFSGFWQNKKKFQKVSSLSLVSGGIT